MATSRASIKTSPTVEELNEYSLQLMWTLRQESFRAFEPLGFRPVRALLLELIGRGYVYPKQLADMLDTVPSAISAMLGELEERGLVAREIDTNDRRRVQLKLTDEGQETRKTLKNAWRDTSFSRLKQLEEDELETLLEIYRKILDPMA
jgi:DNA-binding MarR family transcriptional regulator